MDRIVTVEVWATDDIHADLPSMVEFKEKADKIIKERYNIEVEHFYATNKYGEKQTYDKVFYTKIKPENIVKRKIKSHSYSYYNDENRYIYGFPVRCGAWCNSKLKISALNKIGKIKNSIQYVGIAFDETERVERHLNKNGIVMPLYLAKIVETECRQWCEENELLSPIYTTAQRGGCWFCHNQGIDQLRLLRRNYPQLWELLLKWDIDSPIPFTANGHSVHDYDKRFEAEELGLVPMNRKFRWKMLDKTEKDLTNS